MYVVGARFPTLAAAGAALHAVRASVTVAPGDVAVRPLGSTRYERPADDFLLAGRFADEHVEAVVGIVEANGGQVIERRRELAHPGPFQVRQFGAPGSRDDAAAGRTPVRHGKRPANRVAARPRKRLRRPAARLRVRAARQQRR